MKKLENTFCKIFNLEKKNISLLMNFVIQEAVKENRQDIILFIRGTEDLILKQAILEDKIDILMYIIDKYDLAAYTAFKYAAELENICLMKKLLEKYGLVMLNIDFFKDMLKQATLNNKSKTVEYLTDFFT